MKCPVKNWEADNSFVKFCASCMTELESLVVFPCPFNWIINSWWAHCSEWGAHPVQFWIL